MVRAPDEVFQIKKILQDHPKGINIKTIAAELSINRNTVAKHLDSLCLLGEVEVRQAGISRVFSLSKRLPITSVMELIKDPFVALNQDLTLLEMNESFLLITGQKRSNLSGKALKETNLGSILDRKTVSHIRKCANGGDQADAILSVVIQERTYQVSVIQVVFESRLTGIGLIFRRQADEPVEREPSSRSRPAFVDLKEMTLVLDPELTVIHANNRYCKNIAKLKKDIVGEEFSPRIPNQELLQLKDRIRALTVENAKEEFEYREIMPDGSIQWQTWTFRALYSDDRLLTGYQAIGQDITERKRLEEKLAALEHQLEEMIHRRTTEFREINQQLYQEIQNLERMQKQAMMFQSTIDHATDPVLWVDMHDRIIYANENSTHVLGYAREELLQLKVHTILPGYDSGHYGKMWAQLENKASMIVDTTIQTKSGIRIPVELSISHQKFKTRGYYSIVLRDITRWNILEENRKRLAAIVEANPYLITISDPDLALLYVNTAGRSFLSIGRDEEVRGVKLTEFFAPADREKLVAYGIPGSKLQGTWRGDATMIARTGNNIPVELILIAHRSNDETITHFSTIAIDMSERKKAEMILNESKNKYQTIFDASIDGVLLVTPEGRIVDGNKAACRMFGYSKEVLTTLSAYDLVSKEAKVLLSEIFAKGLIIDRQVAEMLGCRRDKTIFPFAMSSRLVTINGDQTIVFYIHEIIDRKREELTLMAAAFYARSLIEANLDPLFIIDRNGVITDVNRAAEELVGLRRRDLLGTSFSDYTSTAGGKSGVLAQILFNGTESGIPLHIRTASGHLIEVVLTKNIFRNEKGDIQEIFLVARPGNQKCSSPAVGLTTR